MTVSSSSMRIALITTPWFSLPPQGYGGIESICASLADGLVARGHRVTTIGAGPRGTTAEHITTYPIPPSDRINDRVPEIVHAARVAEALNDLSFDIVHDHSSAGLLSVAMRACPTIVTAHFQPDGDEFKEYYEVFSKSVSMAAISESQRRRAPELPWVATVHNAVNVDSIPLSDKKKGDYLLFLGGMIPEKGVVSAINAARGSGRRLVLAGPCTRPSEKQYFEDVVRPLLGPDIEWVGELFADEKWSVLGNAAGLLFPISWDEPFGMVMIEALAAGTPVIGFARGAVPEIVTHGITGFVCHDLDEMVSAIGQLEALEPKNCRERAREYFDVPLMAEKYEAAYRSVLDQVQLSSNIPRLRSPEEPIRRSAMSVPPQRGARRASHGFDEPPPADSIPSGAKDA